MKENFKNFKLMIDRPTQRDFVKIGVV